ncbi:MAG: hypothetical protein PHY91_05620 [Tissierellia bacterium]|nr:hypothetical protein [Tissierellia bacterium]MDD4725995.1 hypothetical protein [Tissierellia bacterium]
MKEKFRRFMSGRYGFDQLSNALITVSIIFILLSAGLQSSVLNTLGFVVLFFSYFRVFSRNIYKRYAENQKFLNYWNPIKGKFYSLKNRMKQSKTHKFYKCPNCNKRVRVPKGKGKIRITCPECKTKFEARS